MIRVTVVWLMLIQINALNVSVIIKRHVMLDFYPPQLEMVYAMMKPIMLHVIMTMETVVYLMLAKITVLNVFVMDKKLVLQDFFHLLSEMAIAMMK